MENLSLQSEIHYHDKLKLHYLEISPGVLLFLNNGNEKGKFNQRVIIKVDNKVEWQAGIVALGEGKGYVTISKDRMKKLDKHLGDTVSIKLEKDDSEHGHEFPIELNELLKQDPDAKFRFDGLSPGKKRAIIYHILQVKSSDKRIERSIQFMKNIKRCPVGQETMSVLFGKE